MAKNAFPTEMVDLPSKGWFYDSDNPLSSGQVELKYMTAKEEDILTSQALLKKGIALDRMLESIIVDTHEPALRIISNKENLSNASDRDHSLEYMIAAGLLFKEVKSETYEDNFSGIQQIENLRKKIAVQENKEFTDNYYDISKRYIANTVYFEYTDGSFSKKETVETPIGHTKRREEAEPLLMQKFIDNMSSHFSEEKAKDIWEKILLIDVDSEFKEVIKLLSND